MKKTFLPILLMLWAFAAMAQGHVYKTYEDYVNNKGIDADASHFNFYKYQASGMLAEVQIKKPDGWGTGDVWGYRWENHLYRFVRIKGPHCLLVIDTTGPYVLYSFAAEMTIYYISKELNAEVHRVNLNDPDKLARRDPYFKPLADYVDTAAGDKDIAWRVMDFNSLYPNKK